MAFINVYYVAFGVASELLALDHQFVVDKSVRRHPEMPLRRKGKEMHKVWKGSVMREATSVHPKNRQSRTASDVCGYTRRHVDDVIEAFELSLHVLQHWSTFLAVEGHCCYSKATCSNSGRDAERGNCFSCTCSLALPQRTSSSEKSLAFSLSVLPDTPRPTHCSNTEEIMHPFSIVELFRPRAESFSSNGPGFASFR